MEAETHNSKRLKQITKHLWDNKKSMSEQAFSEMMETFAIEFFETGYCIGWDAMMRIHRQASTARRLRINAEYNELYNEHSTGKNKENIKPFTISQLDFIGDFVKENM